MSTTLQESERETTELVNLSKLDDCEPSDGFVLKSRKHVCSPNSRTRSWAMNVCGVGGAGQLKGVLPPDSKQRVAFMSLQSKGLWNMSPSS